MFRELFYRIKYKRSRGVPADISAEVREFVELNYVPEAFSLAVGKSSDLPEVSYSMPKAAPRDTGGITLPSHPEQEYESDESRDSLVLLEPSESFSGCLDDVIAGLVKTFQQTLFAMIDSRGYKDSEVYKRANIDRKHFSKIRCNVNYKPSKATALALAVALKLNLDEATDLIGRAGLAFSPSSKQDLIVKYCIMNDIYDIYEVNALLYEYDQPLLGS